MSYVIVIKKCNVKNRNGFHLSNKYYIDILYNTNIIKIALLIIFFYT